jgi:hypothetical protein
MRLMHGHVKSRKRAAFVIAAAHPGTTLHHFKGY